MLRMIVVALSFFMFGKAILVVWGAAFVYGLVRPKKPAANDYEDHPRPFFSGQK